MEILPENTENRQITDAVCVDASCLGNPGVTEYRAVDLHTRQVIFNYKLDEATNNIGEFLGIVHTLALFKNHGRSLNVIYTDSKTALAWVRNKKAKTTFARTNKNAKTFEILARALNWLKTNSYDTKILKWNTAEWGEIPADYGRK
ncbi:MAG: ribonuclease H [Prevotellaceae bacterium]|jgi:ribonuclease HI|nr:ribonuclease H [Prevotellaceae bacterium]